MRYLYGKSWEKYPIEENEKWVDKNTQSELIVKDILKGLPESMYDVDMFYFDPPWSQSNITCFLTKAGKQYRIDYNEFIDVIFMYIENIQPKVVYMEIGKQNLNMILNKFNDIFEYVQHWQIKYYKKNPCYLIRGSNHSIVDVDFTDLDDSITPFIAIENEKDLHVNVIGDFCTGQGLTALAALENNKRFIGVELNKRRMAVTIDKCNKKGANYVRL